MTRRLILRGGLLAVSLAAAFAACLDPTLQLRDGQVLVDSTGGLLANDAGVRVEIPAGAVSAPTAFSLRPSEASLPFGWKAAGPAWLARPEGFAFSAPATVTLPVTAAEGEDVRIATARQGFYRFELLESARSGSTVSAQVAHFSVFVPVLVARDGGSAEPGPDASSGEGADAGLDRWDAGRELTCSAPDAGYCILHPDWLGPECLFKSPCSDVLLTRSVGCSGSVCTCRTWGPQDPVVEWTLPGPWNGDCSVDAYRELWTCGCGFPVLRTSPPCPDAGPPPGPGLPLAANCSQDSDCHSGDCYATYCTQSCDEANPCPCGFACIKTRGKCWPVTW